MNRLSSLTLKSGAHPSPEAGMCFLEAVAWFAGEPHSDSPQCACPVISGVLMSWNDSITDDTTRTKLLVPLIPKVIGTRVLDDTVLLRRMYLVFDWQIRTYTPAFLRVGGFVKEAEALEGLSPIVDQATLDAAIPATSMAESAAENAAESAARYAVWSAVWNAARKAALDAARKAVRNAAENAARYTAWDAAENAARYTAWSAVWNAVRYTALSAAENAAESAAENAAYVHGAAILDPVVAELQASLVRVIEKMCEVVS